MKKKVLKSKYYWLKRRYQDVKLRLRLHTDAIHRATRLWMEQHPREETIPDAATHFAWLISDYERMRDAFKQINSLVNDKESTMKDKLKDVDFIAKAILKLTKS